MKEKKEINKLFFFDRPVEKDSVMKFLNRKKDYLISFSDTYKMFLKAAVMEKNLTTPCKT